MEIQNLVGASSLYISTYSLARRSPFAVIPLALFIISSLPTASAGDPGDFIECYRDCLNGSTERTHQIFCGIVCGVINMF